MKRKRGWLGWLVWLTLFSLMLAVSPWAEVAHAAEPGMEIHAGRSEMDNVLVVTAKLTNLDPSTIDKGIWTYTIDGVGTRTETEGCAAQCTTYFKLNLFETGKTYQVTVTFKNADPSGTPKQVTASNTFVAPPPFEEPEGFGIRCSVDFERAKERFYLYARLEGDYKAQGTWMYKEKGTGRVFKHTGDHDTSFLNIGNTPGRYEAEISFEGTVDGYRVIVASECKYVKEGIQARVEPGSAGMEAFGTLVYGEKATGTWTFQLKDSKGKIVKQGTTKTTSAKSASARFEQIPVGTYTLHVKFDGTVSGKSRILTDSKTVKITSGSGNPPGGDDGNNQSGGTKPPADDPGSEDPGTTPPEDNDDDDSGNNDDTGDGDDNDGSTGTPSGDDDSGQRKKNGNLPLWVFGPIVLAVIGAVFLWIRVYRRM
ncbi:hypothetical protein [Staphylospora marina]|uniref:hypothetical protein n=1 Tax=Staphylospora marina TaxID=2490858 RepID=UPI000F5C0C18|nr:hypothetical protein [Staphylospora marina]